MHDYSSSFLSSHLLLVKRLLLIVAHLALLGFFFPEFRKDFGTLAESMLYALLFLSPVSKILRIRLLLQLMGLRREMGILMGYFATVHGVGYLIDPSWVAIFVVPLMKGLSFPIDPVYLFGMVAYLLTLPLLFTSNTLAQRFLGGRDWKRLHRGVYIVLPLVLLHRFSVGHGLSFWAVLQALSVFALYGMLKVFAWKGVPSFIEKMIDEVAIRYRDFTMRKKDEVLS